MVKTMWKRGGKRPKLPIRRNPEEEEQAEAEIDGEVNVELPQVVPQAPVELPQQDEVMIEEEPNVVRGDDVSEQEEEDAADESNSEIEGDDCPVINEDDAGYKETEPELVDNAIEEDDPFLNVEICEDDDFLAHFGESGGDDGGNEAEEADDSGDDIWNDDIIPDPLSEDDEYEAEYRPSNNHGDDLLALGKCFNNANEFKHALLRYSLKSEYDIHLYKSSSDRLGAKCSRYVDEKCSWKVYCSFEKGRNKLMIKTFVDEHVCTRSGTTKMLKSGTIAELYEERLRVNPKIKPQEMMDEIKREYNMIVTVNQCKRAKTMLARKRKRVHEAHFARLWDYQEEVRSSNPNTTMEIETVPGPVPGSKQRFLRLYVCFGALKEAWKESCRPIIGLDAAFIKWDIKGQMLAAVGRDGDNRIFPIAWAVVDVEDNPNWLWFVQLLKADLGLENGEKFTIISDKHRGILNAVNVELPQAEHRMCSRHILENWKKSHKDIELERMFWKIARSYTPATFANNLEVLKTYNLGAYDALQCTAPTTWTRAFFKVSSCCNDNLNNLSESFNRSVRESRRKPLIDFLTEVRRKVMERNASRSLLTGRWKKRFTPRADREIELNRQKARECIRYRTTGNVHEIDFHGDAWAVDMEKKTCGCGYWQLNGIPCMHAMCVITTTKLNVNDFVSDYYLTSKWKKLYVKGMSPVQGMAAWRRLGRLPILPTQSRFNNGRPHNRARRKGPHESTSNPNKLTRHGRVPTCSNCKKEGHNKTRCSNPTAPPPPKRPRGRPRKEGESSQGQGQASQGETSQARASQGSQARTSQTSQGIFGFST